MDLGGTANRGKQRRASQKKRLRRERNTVGNTGPKTQHLSATEKEAQARGERETGARSSISRRGPQNFSGGREYYKEKKGRKEKGGEACFGGGSNAQKKRELGFKSNPKENLQFNKEGEP